MWHGHDKRAERWEVSFFVSQTILHSDDWVQKNWDMSEMVETYNWAVWVPEFTEIVWEQQEFNVILACTLVFCDTDVNFICR